MAAAGRLGLLFGHDVFPDALLDIHVEFGFAAVCIAHGHAWTCLLYTSDAADERSSVDLRGRRIIKKKKMGQ